MREITQTLTIEGDFITVPLLVWRMLKRQPVGLVEKIYDMNPGLAGLGVFLPVGTKVVVPLETPGPISTRTVVKLWD